MVPTKRRLECGQLLIFCCETLDRLDIAAFGGDREREAGTLGDAVYGDRTCATHAMFAADVNAGCTKSVAQKIGKQRARFALGGTLDSGIRFKWLEASPKVVAYVERLRARPAYQATHAGFDG